MILRAPTRLKPRPGQWIVATNGEGARVLLVTRVLPGRVFFREMANGGSVENFVAPEDVLFVTEGDRMARHKAEAINLIFSEQHEHQRCAARVAAMAIYALGLVTE